MTNTVGGKHKYKLDIQLIREKDRVGVTLVRLLWDLILVQQGHKFHRHCSTVRLHSCNCL